MKKQIFIGGSLAALAFISGCASVPMTSMEEDAKAKQFATSESISNIYIYRNETMGSAIKMPVLIDGMSVGDTVDVYSTT